MNDKQPPIMGFVDRNGILIVNDKSDLILPSHLLMDHAYDNQAQWFLNKCYYVSYIGEQQNNNSLKDGNFKIYVDDYVESFVLFHKLTKYGKQWESNGESITASLIKQYIRMGLTPFGGDSRKIKEAYEQISIRCESSENNSAVPDLITYDAEYFNNNEIPEPEPIIDSILYPGLGMLGAPAKMGKTYMCLQLSCCVATGQKFMGFDILRPGPVLYLDLQGTLARTIKRLREIGFPTMPGKLSVSYSARATDAGLIEQLEKWIANCTESPSLIVIDMFEQVKGSQRKTEDAYRADNRILEPLHDLALKHNLSVLCVMHTRKGNKILPNEDPFNEIIGSIAQFGSADCTWMITGNRKEERKRFSVICRDNDTGQLDYEAMFKNYRWNIAGTVEDCEEEREINRFNHNPVVFTIRKLVEETPSGWIGTMSDLMNEVLNRAHDFPVSTPEQMRRILTEIEYRLSTENTLIKCLNPNGGKNGRRYKIYKINPEQQFMY